MMDDETVSASGVCSAKKWAVGWTRFLRYVAGAGCDRRGAASFGCCTSTYLNALHAAVVCVLPPAVLPWRSVQARNVCALFHDIAKEGHKMTVRWRVAACRGVYTCALAKCYEWRVGGGRRPGVWCAVHVFECRTVS